MLRSMTVENFKCLRNVTVSLEPLTVLIGPNDSGKSSFLEAVHTLGDLIGHGQQGSISSLVTRLWSGNGATRLAWEAEGIIEDGTEFRYALAVLPLENRVVRESLDLAGNRLFSYVAPTLSDGKIEIMTGGAKSSHPKEAAQPSPFLANPPRLLTESVRTDVIEMVRRELDATNRIRFDPDKLREAKNSPEGGLQPDGSNLAAVLNRLMIGPSGARRAFDSIESALRKRIPSVRSIFLRPERPAQPIEFELAYDGQRPNTIPASAVSDGTMLMLGFLTLAYGYDRNILLIEEPENGLHFSNLKVVIETLRSITRGEPKKRQIILTTHSPLLLDLVEPEEIRVFRRTEDWGVKVDSMLESSHVERWKQEFGPGELWQLLGEDALFQEEQP